MWGALATLGAGALTAGSAFAINQANLKNQNAVNDLNINLANTAHQREVADLFLAGLNPILSASGSGAPSNVAQASATQENPLSGLSDSVSQAFSGKQLRKLQTAQTASQLAGADLTVANAQQARTATKIAEEQLKRDKALTEIYTSKDGKRWLRDKMMLDANPKTPTNFLSALGDKIESEYINSAKSAKPSMTDYFVNPSITGPLLLQVPKKSSSSSKKPAKKPVKVYVR